MKKTIAFYSNAFYTGGMENAVYNLIRLLSYSKQYEFYIVSRTDNHKTMKMINKLSELAKIVYLTGNESNQYWFDVLINCSRSEHKVREIKTDKTIHWFSSAEILNKEQLGDELVISQSQYHYDKLKEQGIESKIIGCALDVENIYRKSKEKKIDFPIKYLVVSRLSSEKGFDRLIEFMKKRPLEKVYVIGGDTFGKGDSIKRKVYDELHKRSVFLGEMDNPYPYIAKAEYVLCLSDNELYGLVSEEAHILNKKVIFNRYEAANDQFIQGYDSWFDEQEVVGSAYHYGLQHYMTFNKKKLEEWELVINE